MQGKARLAKGVRLNRFGGDFDDDFRVAPRRLSSRERWRAIKLLLRLVVFIGCKKKGGEHETVVFGRM